jgi:predicted RND superfamily exporter protein
LALQTWIQLVSSRSAVIVAALVVAMVGALPLAASIELNNAPETFFAADPAAEGLHRDFLRAFGADEAIFLQVQAASFRREQDLRLVDKLAEEVGDLEGVASVFSLAPATPRPASGGSLSAVTTEAIVQEIAALPFYRQLGLVVDDPPALGVLVATTGEDRTTVVSQLNELVRRYAAQGRTIVVAGLPPTHVAFDQLTRRALFLFMPLVVLLNVLVGLVLFRSGRALVALLVPVVCTVVLGVAGLSLAGESLNLVTAVLPPLVLAIGFASSLHLVTHYGTLSQQGLSPSEAVAQTMRDKLVPTAFAFATTALGFGSLTVSSVASIRLLGAAAALTLLAGLVVVTLGTPAMLRLLRPRVFAPVHRRSWLEQMAVTALRFRWVVLAGGLAVGCASLWGMTRLKQSINGVQLLAPDSPERVAHELLEAQGLGLAGYELWLRGPVPSREDLFALEAGLHRLGQRLMGIDGIQGTFSAAELLALARHRLGGELDQSPSALARAAGSLEHVASFSRLLDQYWHRQEGVRLTALALTADDPERLAQQRQALLAAAREVFPDREVLLTGHYDMLIGTPGALLTTLSSSLTVTVAVVAVIFLLFFRSLPLALAGMVANLFPVVLALGAMGWLALPIDVATVMTASVIFGIAVDDTFHYLYHRQRAGTVRCAAAIAGQGIVATTLVLSLGFLALAGSGFPPVTRFGLLLSGGAAAALVIDAWVLPALVGSSRELDMTCRAQGGREATASLAEQAPEVPS